MANNITRSPWILDTAAVILADGVANRPKLIRWIGATTAAHRIVIEDGKGRVLFESKADGANFTDVHVPSHDWNGFELAVIDSGILYVEL